jgi:hypothetical protein
MNGNLRVMLFSLGVVVLTPGAWFAEVPQCKADPPIVAPVPQPAVHGCVAPNSVAYRYAMPYIYAYAPPHVADRVAGILNRYVPPYVLGPPALRPYVNHDVYRPFSGHPSAVAGSLAGVRPAAAPDKALTPTLAKPRGPTLASPVPPEVVQADYASTSGGSPSAAGAPEVIPAPPAEGSLVKAGPNIIPVPLLPVGEARQGPREF